MSDHCPGFFELEFVRLYRIQGRVLYKLRHWRKQYACYISKHDELKAQGKNSASLNDRINTLALKIAQYEHLHEVVETEKHNISKNNPANSERAKYERIIEQAYNRAYEPQK